MIRVSLKKKLFSALGDMRLDIDFTVQEGELVTLYGPSGAGKTTVLRTLCGLSIPDEGRILVGDQVWLDSVKKNQPETTAARYRHCVSRLCVISKPYG